MSPAEKLARLDQVRQQRRQRTLTEPVGQFAETPVHEFLPPDRRSKTVRRARRRRRGRNHALHTFFTFQPFKKFLHRCIVGRSAARIEIFRQLPNGGIGNLPQAAQNSEFSFSNIRNSHGHLRQLV